MLSTYGPDPHPNLLRPQFHVRLRELRVPEGLRIRAPLPTERLHAAGEHQQRLVDVPRLPLLRARLFEALGAREVREEELAALRELHLRSYRWLERELEVRR